jgi:hypothetical protein
MLKFGGPSVLIFILFFVQWPLCPSSAHHFFRHSFWVHLPVNDRHLTSQLHGSFSQREQLFFFVTDQSPHPYPTRSLPSQCWQRCTERSIAWVSTKPLITGEIWPGWDLNLGFPSDTPALFSTSPRARANCSSQLFFRPMLDESRSDPFNSSFARLFFNDVGTDNISTAALWPGADPTTAGLQHQRRKNLLRNQ